MTSNDETDAATPQRIDLAEFEDLQHSWRTRSGIYDELFSHWISERKEEIMAELKRCYDLIDSANASMKRTREKVLNSTLDWDDPLFQEVADTLLSLD